MKTTNRLVLFLLIASAVFIFQHQAPAQDAENSLTSGERSAIIDKVVEIFGEYYPLPDVADDMTKFIKRKRKKGEYDQLSDPAEFTAQLTEDLRAESNDYHIRIWPYEKIPNDLLAEIKLGSPDDNYGFRKVEILPGNIGYLNLTSFNNPTSAGQAAVAVMNFLANCKALIIDLRLNGGGDEIMAHFLSSYFFDKSTHLTDVFIRKDEQTKQIWSQEWVSGPRLTDIPVYILLSRYSYSSSECFAYQLQQLGRAVIVGEKQGAARMASVI